MDKLEFIKLRLEWKITELEDDIESLKTLLTERGEDVQREIEKGNYGMAAQYGQKVTEIAIMLTEKEKEMDWIIKINWEAEKE